MIKWKYCIDTNKFNSQGGYSWVKTIINAFSNAYYVQLLIKYCTQQAFESNLKVHVETLGQKNYKKLALTKQLSAWWEDKSQFYMLFLLHIEFDASLIT